MINWKKEGYIKGQEVLVEYKGWVNNLTHLHKGVVTHVGTKILKVESSVEKKLIIFEGKKSSKGNTFGSFYTLYNSEEEYKLVQEKKARKNYLVTIISNSLKGLSLDKLEEIEKIIKENVK